MSEPESVTPIPPIYELNGTFLTGYGRPMEIHRARRWAGPGLQLLATATPESRPEAMFGESSLLPFHFLRTGDRLGRLVVKICRADGASGTGFLVAPDILLTNHHVLPTWGVAAEAVAVADFEAAPGKDEVRRKPIEVRLEPSRLFFGWNELDFAFCGVDGLQDRGAIEIDRSEPLVGAWDVVNIIQHPRGRPKEVTIRDNQVVKADGVVLQYVCDTEPGSSGSPVFDSAWRLMAIHHASVVADRPTLRPARGFDSDPYFLNEGIRLVALALWIESDAAEAIALANGVPLADLERVRALFQGADPRAGLFGARGRSPGSRSSVEFVAEPWKHEGEVLDVAYWDLRGLQRSALDAVVELGPIMNAMGMDVWLLDNVSMARARVIAEHLDTCFQKTYTVVSLSGDSIIALVRKSRAILIEDAPIPNGLRVKIRLRSDPANHVAAIGLMVSSGRAESEDRRTARLKATACDWLVFGLKATGVRVGVWSATGLSGGIELVQPENSCVTSVYLSPNLKSNNPSMRSARGDELIEAATQIVGQGPLAARLVLKQGSGAGGRGSV